MKLEIVFEDGRMETLDSVAGFTVIKEQTANQEPCATEVAQAVNQEHHAVESPIEGKPFEINPLRMDRSLFEKPRKDKKQEMARRIINEAFAEVDKFPEEYAEPFYTLIPAKIWNGYKTIAELKQYAKDLGGQMADWVQWALQLAQRICNGEDWKTVCNNADTAKWYLVIVWKSGYARSVGGSRNDRRNAASEVSEYDWGDNISILMTVPLVAFKKK